ncbi:50S ribosomal protein L25/general stress protein Ctc [Rhodopila sp.]|uniref:50S ribosomal protein L25/general stress protein Ctc n=1 Tax=Rhodopila sp. TaxID=2480087 RepID=UPI003D0B0E0C
MANVVSIEAEARARSGKGAARATRRAGKVPAVIYGGKQDPNLIALDPRVVIREIHRAGWQSRLYEINAGAQPIRALIRGVQFHPVSDAPEHVDFQRLTPGERVKVAIPVHFENDGISPGIKRGAVLNVVRHTVEVYCDADHIPDQFTADLGPLDFNDNVRWHDLRGTENVKPVIDRDFVVATVVPPTKIEVVAEAGAGVAPAKAATPAKGAAKAPAKKG